MEPKYAALELAREIAAKNDKVVSWYVEMRSSDKQKTTGKKEKAQ